MLRLVRFRTYSGRIGQGRRASSAAARVVFVPPCSGRSSFGSHVCMVVYRWWANSREKHAVERTCCVFIHLPPAIRAIVTAVNGENRPGDTSRFLVAFPRRSLTLFLCLSLRASRRPSQSVSRVQRLMRVSCPALENRSLVARVKKTKLVSRVNRICSFVVRNAACVRFFSRLTYLF